ncbi:MAG TPA: hypothetical protein PLE61_10675 [Vicinamibacterales bacterium]|nr:hypothetical protein [Vicinamibacterales bacterium]HPW21261.1 hypothetical protein [Vicinamibacterales bacterium]
MAPSDRGVERPASPPRLLDFARAFRGAARAVAFYPPSHQKVAEAVHQLMAAARAATSDGAVCLTVLPHGLMAGGAALDPRESAFSDLAAICHRHGIGAVILDGRASADAWRALFTLLARKPEELRAAGGVQRQWKALRHPSPAMLEIDFGALLRGQVGGDFVELAGVISHYLETAGVGGSILDDPCGALRRALESAPDDEHAIAALLRELRAAAQLTWTQPEQFNEVFRRAAAIGEFLTERMMAALLERRGTPEAVVGQVDVVQTLIEHMPDATISKFLTNAMAGAGAGTERIVGVLASLVPDAQRRRLIVSEAQDVALGAEALEQWAALERNLDKQSDARFVPETYVEEIHTVQDRAGRRVRRDGIPPARLAAWLRSIGEDAVRDADLRMLADLAQVESDPIRARRVLELLQAHVLEAADLGDWDGAARTAEVVRGLASTAIDETRRRGALEVLERLSQSAAVAKAYDSLADADEQASARLVRLLSAAGPAMVPVLVPRWAAESRKAVRSRFEQAVVGCGKPGRDALRRLLATEGADAAIRIAAVRLLAMTPGDEHLPLLESALSNRHQGMRDVAFDVLAHSPLERARDILARGIARADADVQAALLERLRGLGPDLAVPVFRRLFGCVDPRTADLRPLAAMIASLGRVGGGSARPLLADVARRVSWRTPLRAWRVRSAVASALRETESRAAPVGRPTAAGGGSA